MRGGRERGSEGAREREGRGRRRRASPPAPLLACLFAPLRPPPTRVPFRAPFCRSRAADDLFRAARSIPPPVAAQAQAQAQAKHVPRTAFPPRKGFLNAETRAILDRRVVVVLQHNNLTFAEWIAARGALAKHGIQVRVVRNVLVRAQIAGGRYEAMRPLFAGPTALAYTDDEDVAVTDEDAVPV